jgi:hypothetical protein
MACGEVQDVEVTSYHWCWTWHGPWRCKKTTLERRYVYDFVILRRRYRGFSVTFRGCCEFDGGEFTWSEWSWRLWWNPPDQSNVTRRFDHQLVSTGPCSLGTGTVIAPRIE